MKTKFILALSLVCMIFSFTASAKAGSEILTAPRDFYVLGEQTEKLAEVLQMTTEQLATYKESNNVEYLAVNEDNSKQIRLTVLKTDFSNSIINISSLSNSKIKTLAADIVGIDGIGSEVMERNGQKFLKTRFESTDSGGKYILTQYYTVADRKAYTLSFYTAVGESDAYTEKVFDSFNMPTFNNVSEKDNTYIELAILIAIIVFSVVAVIIISTVIIDIRKRQQ